MSDFLRAESYMREGRSEKRGSSLEIWCREGSTASLEAAGLLFGESGEVELNDEEDTSILSVTFLDRCVVKGGSQTRHSKT